MFPGGAARLAKVAFRLGPATEIPRQFGPMSRAPCARTSASSCSCRSAPSRPTSANPAEMTTSAHPLRRRVLGGFEHDCSRGRRSRRGRRRRGSPRSTVAAHAGHRAAVAVDRVGGAGEVGLEDVAEELAADRAAPARGADDGDAAGLEERAQRGGDGDVVALVDPLLVALGRRDRELDLDLAPASSRVSSKPSPSKTPSMSGCPRAPRRRSARCPRARPLRELLDEPGADPAPLVRVRDGERGLRDRGIAQALVVRDRDDALAPVLGERPEERAALAPVRVEELLDELGPSAGKPWKRR